jgi:hypothetical protein
MSLSEPMRAVISSTLDLLRHQGHVAAMPRDLVQRMLDAQIVLQRTLLRVEFTTDEIARMRAEIEARLSVTIGSSMDLVDGAGHEEWYHGSFRAAGPFLARYLRRLAGKGWAEDPLERLKETTSRVLELVENPARPGPWDRRGLVVGQVQSGKTAHYTGVICRAADAGYRVIIVLAGMHNLLRSQTQKRLDADFLGFDSIRRMPIGVGLDTEEPRPRADFATTSAIGGDFSKQGAAHLGFAPDRTPWLFVLKKNASVLAALNSWIEDLRQRSPARHTHPRRVVDDEADQASIDTNEQQQREDGTFDPDHDPTRINGQIRRLLRAFSRSAYVAYTATPFANILIHDEAIARDYGSDLFPSGFVIGLPVPSTYIGPAALFGLDGDAHAAEPPLPVIRSVPQADEAWVTPSHQKDYRPLHLGEDRIPPSLERALCTFILARAARVARDQATEHASMLVHVSRFTAVHGHVHRQVKDWLDRTKRTIDYALDGSALETALERLWRDDFEPTTRAVLATRYNSGVQELAWIDVRRRLQEAVERIQVAVVNSDSKSALDYDDFEGRGLHAIAIGGDKLSRGLTLEGLLVSYFLRTSMQYDTLMQMGRWFGYRPGYADLCRIFLTDDLEEWFRHIATASEELRIQFNHMAVNLGTPKDYGLRVASHDVLAVTAANKMRSGELIAVSFAGEIKIQTVFERATERIESNFRAVDGFFRDIRSRPERNPVRPDGSTLQGVLWRNVPGADVATLLSTLTYAEESYDVNKRLSDYILECARSGELTSWTVVAAGGKGEPCTLGGESMLTREFTPRRHSDLVVSFGTILDPPDEAIDLTAQEYADALALTIKRVRSEDPTRKEPHRPSGPEIRKTRGRDSRRGLLIVYPISTKHAELQAETSLAGIVVSFPASAARRAVTYVVNSVQRRLDPR